jgi:hypothetical protein
VLVTIDKQAKNACIIYKLHLILSIVSSCWHFVFRTLQWLVIIFWLSNYLWVQQSLNKSMFIWCLEPLNKLNTEMYV